MSADTYKATFRKSTDGLAINSMRGIRPEVLSEWIAHETKALLKGNVAPDGFVIEVKPIEVVPDEC